MWKTAIEARRKFNEIETVKSIGIFISLKKHSFIVIERSEKTEMMKVVILWNVTVLCLCKTTQNWSK